jgi:transposase-like protein/IS1 family transposase
LQIHRHFRANAGKNQVTCHCCNGETKKFGRFQNHNRIVQRYQCLKCGKTMSESQPLDGLRVDFKQAAQVVHLLCEGMGIRSIERFTGLNRRTVLGILATAGRKCAALLDAKIHDVQCSSVQCDELYSFVFCRELQNKLHLPEIGEQYTFLGVDRESKLILSHYVGKREQDSTDVFIADLRKRVKGEPQITTDGFSCYQPAVENAFGENVHFAQQVKQYADGTLLTKLRRRLRRSMPREKRCVGVKTTIRIGNPDRALISTSHVERTNLSVRLFNRRYTRLTMGYSKTLENHQHALALFIFHFNFCRIHSAHGQTPAMAAKIENHQWTIEEFLTATI